MTRVVKQAQVRRSEIIDAAAELFLARGYAGTTVAGIIEAIGIAKGGFYHHFASKEEVFEACVARLADQMTTQYVEVLTDESMSAADRVRGYLERAYRAPESARESSILTELHTAPSELHDRVVSDAVERLIPALTVAISAGQFSGAFRLDGDPEPAAVAILGALRELHLRYADRPNSSQLIDPTTVTGFVERLLNTQDPVQETTR